MRTKRVLRVLTLISCASLTKAWVEESFMNTATRYSLVLFWIDSSS